MLHMKKNKMEILKENEILKFLFVGILNTLIGLSIIYTLIYLDLNDYIANFIGYIIGLSVGFILNKYYVFKKLDAQNKYKEIMFFIIVFCISYLVNIIILYISLNYFISYIAQLFAMISYTIVNFVLNKYITFNIRRD